MKHLIAIFALAAWMLPAKQVVHCWYVAGLRGDICRMDNEVALYDEHGWAIKRWNVKPGEKLELNKVDGVWHLSQRNDSDTGFERVEPYK